jgi:hypothetical protein
MLHCKDKRLNVPDNVRIWYHISMDLFAVNTVNPQVYAALKGSEIHVLLLVSSEGAK